MSQLYLVIPLASVLLLAQFFPLINASTGYTGITINNIQPNELFIIPPTLFSGTYASPDPQPIVNTDPVLYTPAPIITVIIDSTTYGTATLSGNNWAIDKTAYVADGLISNIPDGWHTLTVFIHDSNGDKSQSVQFDIMTSKFVATKYQNLIAIEYSNTCQTLINNNITSDCPSVKELMQWDNSNQAVSGHFRLQKDGTFIREKPQVTNFYSFYSNQTTTVCVLCDVDLASVDTTPIIFIEPHGFSYASTNANPHPDLNATNGDNGTISITGSTQQETGLLIYHDRYVEPTCNIANMAYTPFLMNDTIHYLESECTKTQFNQTTTTPVPNTPIDYAHAHQIQVQNWQSQSLQINKGNCITQKCVIVKDPNEKEGY